MEARRRPSIIRHPLRDPMILERIFGYLAVEDLKVCRMALKVWHEPATRLLSERISGIPLHEKTEWKKFLKILTKSCTSTRLPGLSHIHPFHSFIFHGCYPEDPSWTPYKSAILDYMHAKVKLPKKTVWEEKFFSTFGLQILELRYCQFNFLNTERALREFREMLSTNCPNLTVLTLEFQKDTSSVSTSSGSSGSAGATSTNSKGGTPTASPSPSPSPNSGGTVSGGLGGGSSNVFFPPNEESLRKSMNNLRKFTFCTDNKCWVNPNALEEFMSFMPCVEEFTYRYTGAKKQWAFVRRVDVIDIICNLIQCRSLNNLKVLDLDSKGTVLSGEDFRKLTAALNSYELKEPTPAASKESQTSSIMKSGTASKIRLTRFASQVFIKSEQDWDYFCSWLSLFNFSLKEIDIQVRSHFSQLPAEEQLPTTFPKVHHCTLLLDNNFQVFLKRMPNVQKFSGVYDNELLPFCSATQNLSLDGGGGTPTNSQGGGAFGGHNTNGSTSSTSSTDGLGHTASFRRRSSKRSGRSMSTRSMSIRSRSKSEDYQSSTPPPTPSGVGAVGATHPPSIGEIGPLTSLDFQTQPACCTNAKYLRIYSNEESMLDIEWKAGLFRHVTSLETDVYFDQDLRLIWTHLQLTLTELRLHLRTLIPEQAFTGAGVGPLTFQELTSKPHSHSRFGRGSKDSAGAGAGGCTGEIDYHDEDHLTPLDEFPNLGMMKLLRIFEIYTEGRQDAFGSQFSASIIVFGVSLLPLVERLVLPPAIPPKCLENSISYLGKLNHLRYLAVCDDTFQSVLPFHVLKCGLPDLEIVVKYYQSDIKRILCNPWRAERLIFPDFLPEHRTTSLGGPNSFTVSTASSHTSATNSSTSSSVRSRFHLSKQCSAP